MNRAPSTRAHTLTVAPTGALRVRATSNGGAAFDAGTRTVSGVSVPGPATLGAMCTGALVVGARSAVLVGGRALESAAAPPQALSPTASVRQTRSPHPRPRSLMAASVPDVTLNNGVSMPQLGFGVFQVPPDEVVAPVRVALEAGYRLLDTAAIYRNEKGVGRAIAESGVARDELFVTTKLWNSDQGYDSTLKAFETSVSKLGLEVLDLYLIHWPTPARDLYVETWKAFEQLYRDGRVRSIGVSNFTPHQLRRLHEETDIVPVLNQIELHPKLDQAEARAFHREHQILTEAWSPIGQGQGLLDDPVIVSIATQVDRTPAQVVLRWHIQLGNVVIPKSQTPERIRSNIEVFDFELSAADMGAISAMSSGGRIGPDPDTFNLA
jgi:2,5-diketo-D-gluconate reductase A